MVGLCDVKDCPNRNQFGYCMSHICKYPELLKFQTYDNKTEIKKQSTKK